MRTHSSFATDFKRFPMRLSMRTPLVAWLAQTMTDLAFSPARTCVSPSANVFGLDDRLAGIDLNGRGTRAVGVPLGVL